MRRALLLLAILLAPACSQAPVAGPLAGSLFTLTAVEGLAPVGTEATRDVPATPTPAPVVDAPAVPPTPEAPSPSPSTGGVIYTSIGGGGSGGGGAPPPPPPTPPGVAIAPTDGGFKDSGATETGVVGP
jgi:hypothetical protein